MKLYKHFLLRLNTRFGARLVSGSFTHNVLLMFIGTAIGQMGSVILSPVLTRIYTPDDFGILGVYMTVVGILSLIASLRYEIAIPLTKTDEEANNMLAICVFSLVISSFIISALLYLTPIAPDFLQSSMGTLWQYRMMIPLGVFAIGAYQICVSYATHKQTFKVISQTKVYQGYGGPITQIIFGFAGANIWGLIIGFVVGQSMGVTLLLKKIIPHPRKIMKDISQRTIKLMAWRFRDFPLISSVSVIIGVLGGESLLIMFILTVYHSTTVVGFIFLISRIVGRPLLMMSTSMLQVYIGDVSKTRTSDPEAMRDRFLKVLRFQFIAVSAWLAVINATAQYLIPFVFGNQWVGCIPYIYILTISYLPQMTLHAVANTLQILEKQKLSAMLDVVRLLMLICVFVLSYIYELDIMQLVFAYSVTQALSCLISFVLTYKAIEDIQNN